MKSTARILLLILLFGLIACTNQVSSTPTLQQKTPGSFSEHTPTPTYISSYNSPLTRTAVFLLEETTKLSFEQQEEIIKLFDSNKNCTLPCFWGIMPGVTVWRDAEDQLNRLVNFVNRDEKYLDGTFIQYRVPISLTTQASDLSVELSFSVGGDGNDDNVVERISLDFYNGRNDSYKSVIHKYTPEEVFRSMGKPDRIYIGFVSGHADMGYRLAMIYENQDKSVFSYGLYPNNNKTVCPSYLFGDRLTSLDFSLAYIGSEVSLFLNTGDRLPEENPEYWRLVQKEIGLSEEQFYDQMLTDPASCFELASEKK